MDQLPLQFARVGPQHPVARLALHVITEAGEALFGPTACSGSQRRAESFVGPLMRVHERPDCGVLRFFGRTADPTIVGEREQYGRRGESTALWIVPREAVIEIDEFVDELNRNYHRVDGYPLKEKLKEARERASRSAAGGR